MPTGVTLDMSTSVPIDAPASAQPEVQAQQPAASKNSRGVTLDMSTSVPIGASATASTQKPEDKNFFENFMKENGNPAASYGEATRYGADTVAQGTLDAIKGAVNLFHPAAQNDSEREAFKIAGVGGVLIHRMLEGPVKAAMSAPQIASAIHDINQSSDPVGTYAKIVQETSAQGAGQALTAIGTEGAGKTVAAAGRATKANLLKEFRSAFSAPDALSGRTLNPSLRPSVQH